MANDYMLRILRLTRPPVYIVIIIIIIIITILIIYGALAGWSSDHSRRRTLTHVNFFTLTVTLIRTQNEHIVAD